VDLAPTRLDDSAATEAAGVLPATERPKRPTMKIKQYAENLRDRAFKCGWQNELGPTELGWAAELVAEEVARYRFGRVAEEAELSEFSEAELDAHAWAFRLAAECYRDVLNNAVKLSKGQRGLRIISAVGDVIRATVRERVRMELREGKFGELSDREKGEFASRAAAHALAARRRSNREPC